MQQYGLRSCAKINQLKPKYINIKINGQKPQDKKATINEENQAVNIFNNVILARNRQLLDDDRMIETCRSIF